MRFDPDLVAVLERGLTVEQPLHLGPQRALRRPALFALAASSDSTRTSTNSSLPSVTRRSIPATLSGRPELPHRSTTG
ncbi:MAG TPA: hypothetical protein VII33_07850, partial [Nakamurella sp.]